MSVRSHIMTPTIRLLIGGASLFITVLRIHAAESAAETPPPETQNEKTWVDDRWNQTELGPFQTSTLEVPDGTVLKAISIRLGEHDEAAVCYDPVLGNVRAGWTGGFLRFDPARYGIINKPKIGGEIRFTSSGEGWTGGNVQYQGLTTNGRRVVLRLRVSDRAIAESPWVERDGEQIAFTRTFLLEPGDKRILEIARSEGAIAKVETIENERITHLDRDGQSVATAAIGALIQPAAEGCLRVEIPAGTEQKSAKVFLWSGPTADLTKFAAIVKAHSQIEDLKVRVSPASPRWTPLTTRGVVGSGAEAYLIDTLTVPYDNPWKALFFLSGVDFLSSGEALVCTIHGDVWKVSGVDEKLEQLTWRRFATGLFQPLGLRVVKDKIYVLGRDRITLLEDANGDGEAERYESFSDLIETLPGGHDFVACLETDATGNFYYADPRGVHRIAADGKSKETIATGWRNPNGMSVGPDGTITVAPQQGNWTPSSQITEVTPGGFYGFGGPQVTARRPLGYDLPLCWIPHSVDNSTGSQVWVTSDRWGPLRGQLLNLSYGRCTMQLVLREKVEGQPQGGVVPLPGRFLSGVMRGTFHPRDGQLYVVGTRGWQTAGSRDGCFQRVRFAGKKLLVPIALHAHTKGVTLSFTEPLDRETAEDAGSYSAEQWNYEYAKTYGSKEFSVSSPQTNRRDEVAITSARLLDERSVMLEIPGIKPVMQMHLQWNLDSREGAPIRGEVFNTIHQLGSPP